MLTIQLGRDGTAIVGALVPVPGRRNGVQTAQGPVQTLSAAERLLAYLEALRDPRAAVIRLTQLIIYQRMTE